jgi:hypothetical protein
MKNASFEKLFMRLPGVNVSNGYTPLFSYLFSSFFDMLKKKKE